MKFNKELVNQKIFKISESRTFYKTKKDIVESETFKNLIRILKPIKN